MSQSSRAARTLISEVLGINKVMAGEKLEKWMRDGVILVGSYQSPKTRKMAEKLTVNPDAKLRLRQAMNER